MYMLDGQWTTVEFPASPGIIGFTILERTVKPFGFDGRGPIDVKNMRSLQLVPKISKRLMDVTAMTLTVIWDPVLYDQIWDNLLGLNQEINIFFPTFETEHPINGPGIVGYGFYGWVDKFDPQEHQEGELPLANMTIEVSNLSNLLIETVPWQL